MADCCTNTLDLGCVGFCGTIETGLTAPATDTYVISLIGSGGYASYDFTAGQEITFTNPFNEDSVAVFQILRSGQPVSNGIYDCYQVKVTAGVQLTTQTEEEDMPIYKVYTALLTQSGLDSPVATVLENTLGGTVKWSRSAAGVYTGTLTSAFPQAKTWAVVGNTKFSVGEPGEQIVDFYRTNDNEVGIEVNSGDDFLSGFPIEIRIYP